MKVNSKMTIAYTIYIPNNLIYTNDSFLIFIMVFVDFLQLHLNSCVLTVMELCLD